MPDKPHSELSDFEIVSRYIAWGGPDMGKKAAREAFERLVEQLETWQEIAESSRDWRKSDEFIGLMVRARVPKEWPHSNPASEPEAS